jgi:hypothetical protein
MNTTESPPAAMRECVSGVVRCPGCPNPMLEGEVEYSKCGRESDLSVRIHERLLDEGAFPVPCPNCERLRAAMEWLLNLAHDVGKAGGKPEPGEWEAAWDEARALTKHEGENDDG